MRGEVGAEGVSLELGALHREEGRGVGVCQGGLRVHGGGLIKRMIG